MGASPRNQPLGRIKLLRLPRLSLVGLYLRGSRTPTSARASPRPLRAGCGRQVIEVKVSARWSEAESCFSIMAASAIRVSRSSFADRMSWAARLSGGAGHFSGILRCPPSAFELASPSPDRGIWCGTIRFPSTSARIDPSAFVGEVVMKERVHAVPEAARRPRMHGPGRHRYAVRADPRLSRVFWLSGTTAR